MEHRAKMREPFKQFTGKNLSFTSDLKTYGLDGELLNAKRTASSSIKHYTHDRKFKPSGPMKQYIGGFPEYM